MKKLYDWEKHFKDNGLKGIERKDQDFAERQVMTKIFQTVILEYGYKVFFGTRVLDYGCGIGRFTDMFLKARCQYYGVDIVKSNIVYCSEKHIRNIKSDFTLINQLNPMLLNISNIETIFTSTVLQHITDLTAIQKEFKRVLAPDGYMILFENTSRLPNSENGFMTFRRYEDYRLIFDFVDLKRKIDIIDIAGERHTLMIGRRK